MKALVWHEWGGPEVLRLEEVEPPEAGEGEVLIDVEATAVNYADSIMVAGHYQTKPPFPFSPGLETAGRIRATGPGVEDLQPGQRFEASLPGGQKIVLEFVEETDGGAKMRMLHPLAGQTIGMGIKVEAVRAPTAAEKASGRVQTAPPPPPPARK